MKNRCPIVEVLFASNLLFCLCGCGSLPSVTNSAIAIPGPTSESSPDWENESEYRCLTQFEFGRALAVTRNGQIVELGDPRLRSKPPISFANCVGSNRADTVWVAGDGKLWLSVDNGGNWRSTELPEDSINVSEIRFESSSHGWLLTSFHILETRDGGNTWLRAASFRRNLKGQPVDFSVGTDGSVAVCDNLGWVYLRRGGQTQWNASRKSHPEFPFCSVFITTADSISYWSSEGVLLKTSRGWPSWKPVGLPDSAFELQSQFWFDAATGFVAGYLKPYHGASAKVGRSALFLTIDGGNTWRQIHIDDSSPFF